MNAEIVAIGDELTSGQRLDTNSQWLSDQLGNLGVAVHFHSTVGDQLEAMLSVLRTAIERADVVVCTGGLGPTADDLTRQALADLLGCELVLDSGSLEHIERLFQRRKRSMPERNRIQAMFPAGSRPIPNPHGTAPGIELAVARPAKRPCQLFALPGVPAEMHEMFQETVAPAVRRLQGDPSRRIRHYRLKCFGVGESDLEQMLPDLIRRGREPQVGITVSRATITLRVTAEGDSDEHCRQVMEPTIAIIRDCLRDLIFGEEDDELQQAVLRQLRARQQTLATAESISGGLLTRWLSQADEAAGLYRGGLVLNNHSPAFDSDRASAEARTPAPGSGGPRADLPGPSFSDRLDTPAAVEALARRIRDQFSADIGLALGSLPGPATAGGDRVPMAIATRTGCEAAWAPYSGHPDILQTRCAKHALDVLRKRLLSETAGN